MIYARGRSDTTGKNLAWVYTGSANMSESAWGKLVWDAQRKEWKINCKNWECGVLVRVPDDRLNEGEAMLAPVGDKDTVSMGVFDGIATTPFSYPGQLYGGRNPWYFTEPHAGARP